MLTKHTTKHIITGDYMIINYDKDKLLSALYDFYYATDIVVDLIDVNFQVILHTPVKTNNYCCLIHQMPEGTLIHTNTNMEDISQTVGFSSASYYSKQFKKQK